jgi:hypothetical protein
MINLLKQIGPQVYASPKKGKKRISINMDLDHVLESRIINFTGYAWSDQKFGLVMSLLKNSRKFRIVHDSDYLGLSDHAAILREMNHEVLFVLAPKDRTRKNIMSRDLPYCSPLSPGIATASNARIRKAHDRLKEAGVKVKKFKSMAALAKYLSKKQAA